MATHRMRIARGDGANPGAPNGMLNSELHYNPADKTLRLGVGFSGVDDLAAGTEVVGGIGVFPTLTGEATISGAWTFTTLPRSPVVPSHNNDLVNKKYVDDSVGNAGGGDMLKSAYDQNNDGKVDAAEVADHVPWAGVTNPPSLFPPTEHNHPISGVTGLGGVLEEKAPLVSPALTGNPTAPTQAVGNNTTRIATTAFVTTAVSALIDAAPGTLDTLNEIAAALGDDPNFAATMTSGLAGKLTASNNLSDVTDAATARSNLGVGALGTKNAITAADLDGLILDGGTF